MSRNNLRWYVWFGSWRSKPVTVEAVNRDKAEIAACAKASRRRAGIVEVIHVGKVKTFRQITLPFVSNLPERLKTLSA